MFRKQDPYSYTQFQTLYINKESTPKPIGLIALEYQVALYNNVQVLNEGSVTQSNTQQFVLKCTQRILLQNADTSLSPILPEPPEKYETYIDYPVLFKAGINIPTTGLALELLDYSPHTVNTSVQQSTSHADESQTGTGTTTSNTTGTSNSQSSTYGVTVTAGDTFSGVAASYEYSTSSTHEQSNTNEKSSSASASKDSSASASMSVKNWGAYAWIDPHTPVTPYWVFGQEYPWNAIQCRYTEGKTSACKGKAPYEGKVPYKVPMTISTSMANNLYDGAFLYPPSELSLYSLNFVVKAAWRIYVDYENSTKITVANPIEYYSASHNLSPAIYNEKTTRTPNVYMDQFPTDLLVKSGSEYVTPSTTLDLNLMALDPVGVNTDSAIVGFIPNRFIPLPAPSGQVQTNFKTIATTNDLLIEDTTDWRGGASEFTVSQTCLTATWNSNTHDPYEITLYFKVTDSVSDYTLHMKHWIKTQEDGRNPGVALTLEVNKGNPNPITIPKYVNAPEAEGGENNILSIALRDLDFASVEYHDYLQLGLNSVTITMKPIDKASTCGYQIRAVSIVKS